MMDFDEAHEAKWLAEERLRRRNKREITDKVFEKLYHFSSTSRFDWEIRRMAREIVNIVLQEWRW